MISHVIVLYHVLALIVLSLSYCFCPPIIVSRSRVPYAHAYAPLLLFLVLRTSDSRSHISGLVYKPYT